MHSADPQPRIIPRLIPRLITLGGLAIAHDAGTAAPSSPPRRRLALLAMIAAAGEVGISRDKLLYYFWPESDEERARHALAQTLYALRRDLGASEVLAGSSQLRLADGAITSDVGELAAALERGDVERAASLYTGPFLDGVHLSGLADFERWAEEERARIAARIRRALEQLAAAATRDGAPEDAERWWRRLATLDPLDARYAAGLMGALAACGNSAAALRHAHVYETLVRQELGAAPAAEVLALAQRLRDAPAPAAPSPAIPSPAIPSPAAPSPERREHAPGSGTAAGASPAALALSPPLPAAARTASPQRARRLAWPAGLAAAAVFAAVFALRTPGRASARGMVDTRGLPVIVTDIENATGDSIFDRALPLALASGLEQSGRVSLFPRSRVREVLALMGRSGADTALDESLAREIAQRAGLRLIIVPAIARVESSYVVMARVVDAATGTALASAEARAAGRGRVLPALGTVSATLRRRMGGPPAAVTVPESAALPVATTTSLEALQLFAAGRRAFNNAQYAVAVDLYRAALERDSNFALARSALGATYYWLNDRPRGDSQFDRALALTPGLGERERLQIEAEVAGWRGDREGQIRILSGFLQRYPGDLAASSKLAYAYLRSGRHEEARALYERLLAVDSTDVSNLLNLATTYAALRRPAPAVRTYRRAFALDSTRELEPIINNEYGAALVQAGLPGEARATFEKLLPIRDLRGRALRSLAYLDLYEGRHAQATARLAEAIQIDVARGYPLSEARDRLFRATTLADAGRVAEARAERAAIGRIVRRSYLEPKMLAWIGQADARSGDIAPARELLGLLRGRSRPENTDDRAAGALLGGEIALAAGRTAAADSQLALALELDSTTVVLDALANAAWRRGDLARASALYRALGESRDFGWEGERPKLLAPYWLARVEDARGNRAAAAQAYGQFVARWARGDSNVALLADARRRLAALRRSDQAAPAVMP